MVLEAGRLRLSDMQRLKTHAMHEMQWQRLSHAENRHGSSKVAAVVSRALHHRSDNVNQKQGLPEDDSIIDRINLWRLAILASFPIFQSLRFHFLPQEIRKWNLTRPSDRDAD